MNAKILAKTDERMAQLLQNQENGHLIKKKSVTATSSTPLTHDTNFEVNASASSWTNNHYYNNFRN